MLGGILNRSNAISDKSTETYSQKGKKNVSCKQEEIIQKVSICLLSLNVPSNKTNFSLSRNMLNVNSYT